MGRIFETRKHKIFARNDRMAKAFTRIGKDIAMSVKSGGPDPANNARLRIIIQNAKGLNMPKDRVDAAIKRAVSKDEKDYHEMIYEGYAPHGVALVVETATDNPTRTVANLRLIFSKGNGTMGSSGSVGFMFDRKSIFKIAKSNINLDEMELDLIDFGAEEIEQDDDNVIIYAPFTAFGNMQKGLESKNIPVVSAELVRIPTNYKEGLSEAEEEEVLNLVANLEADDDVQQVFYNLK
jgi:YebC/PmpR family DNA-binding regulatory protein